MRKGRKFLWGMASSAVVGLVLAIASGAVRAEAEGPVADSAATEGAGGLQVGKPIEDFGLRQLDFTTGKLGPLVWLSDFVGDKPDRKTPSKLLLLNFFATWCKPCMAELPVLTRLHSQYAANGLRVLSINFRADSEAVDDAIKGTQKAWSSGAPSFPVLFDRYTNRNQLIYMGARAGLPCNILIDEHGVVLARFQGGDASELAAIEARIRKQLNLPDVASSK